MNGTNTSIYLHDVDRKWLDRGAKGQRSKQLRDDLELLRRLLVIFDEQPHTSIAVAMTLAKKPGN